MKPTVRELVIGLAAVVAFLGYTRWDARRDGKVALELAQNREHTEALETELRLRRAQFTVDTVRVFKRITNTVTTLDTLVRSDTLRLTDTVKVTVEVVREAATALNACRDSVRSCGALRATEQARGDSLQARVKLMEKQKPSVLLRWVERGASAAAIIYLAGRK